MASQVKFPIRAKLLLLISGVVLAATATYLSLAVKLFKDDKTQLVYELNASTVKTLAAQIEASLLKTVDKVKLLTQGHQEVAWSKAVFEAERDLIAYTLYRASDDIEGWKPVASVRNSEYLKMYGLSVEALETLREQIPVPFEKAISKRVIALNSTLSGGAPMITLAVSIDVRRDDSSRVVPHVAVVDLRLDGILRLLTGEGVAQAYVVDDEGRIIAHPDAERVVSRAVMGDVEIVREAVDSRLAFGMKRFLHKGSPWIGAYASVGVGGLSVISQVEESQAFRAATRLIEKSLLFAGLVITIAILISGWLARSFTNPLRSLLGATEKLSRWEFGESVHVKTRDEIASLARAFNSMASDLQRQHQELESSRRELELKVKERTAALENQKKQASEAQNALLRTTRLASLGELAGATAHEVLNPLNNMNIRIERTRKQGPLAVLDDIRLMNEIVTGWKKSFVDGGWKNLEKELSVQTEGGKLLLEEDLENLESISADVLNRVSEHKEDTEFLAREITRITRMVNNMRSLSRVGGERRPLDVHVPMDDTVVTLSDILEKRQVSLLKEYSADTRDSFVIVGDRDELVQVFSNLIRNALHAIDQAKRRAGIIRVITRRAGDRVEVRIVDNGTGIRAEHLPRLFEPSFTTKSVEEGTGLGLSISRRLVRAFGGDIEVEKSVEGDGTTFLVWFPFYSRDVETTNEPSNARMDEQES